MHAFFTGPSAEWVDAESKNRFGWLSRPTDCRSHAVIEIASSLNRAVVVRSVAGVRRWPTLRWLAPLLLK
jgi:hypothetical protein